MRARAGRRYRAGLRTRPRRPCVPAAPVKAVDTVGAGDTLVGALVTALAEGQSIDAALSFAQAAAALAVC
ncbi:PfkB family carbohydrate kinase [Roseateles sp.]|uniref:PfkB family carbohydrate kinase n=1 Tax=Roseateles sp. TaxID=1971397 RepID=UPI00387E8ACF